MPLRRRREPAWTPWKQKDEGSGKWAQGTPPPQFLASSILLSSHGMDRLPLPCPAGEQWPIPHSTAPLPTPFPLKGMGGHVAPSAIVLTKGGGLFLHINCFTSSPNSLPAAPTDEGDPLCHLLQAPHTQNLHPCPDPLNPCCRRCIPQPPAGPGHQCCPSDATPLTIAQQSSRGQPSPARALQNPPPSHSLPTSPAPAAPRLTLNDVFPGQSSLRFSPSKRPKNKPWGERSHRPGLAHPLGAPSPAFMTGGGGCSLFIFPNDASWVWGSQCTPGVGGATGGY